MSLFVGSILKIMLSYLVSKKPRDADSKNIFLPIFSTTSLEYLNFKIRHISRLYFPYHHPENFEQCWFLLTNLPCIRKSHNWLTLSVKILNRPIISLSYPIFFTWLTHAQQFTGITLRNFEGALEKPFSSKIVLKEKQYPFH